MSGKLIPLFLKMGSQQQAEAIISKYNLAVFPVDESASQEKQAKTQQRALEKLEKSIQIVSLTESLEFEDG